MSTKTDEPRYFNDYDLFEVGETWYLVEDVDFYIDNMFRVTQTFKAYTEVEILSIERDYGYGHASIRMDGHEFKIGLDELYDMVWE